jgi:uncharacterized protein (DUF362 family)
MIKGPLSHEFSRRAFLRRGLYLTAGAPLALSADRVFAAAAEAAAPTTGFMTGGSNARVAIVPCTTYDSAVDAAMRKSFDLLGGVGSLVKDKTVTVKINLTGTNFQPYLGRPVGETYMTHYEPARALAAAVLAAGARRVRFVESTNSRSPLQDSLTYAEWDVKALEALGRVEFENTRNLGSGKEYAHLKVPKGYTFDSFDLNHCYGDTDVMVSLCKLKHHVGAGITLSLKNQFGNTPNSLYGTRTPNEESTGGRGPLHQAWSSLPGVKQKFTLPEGGSTLPRVVIDLCAARPIHLAVIDGITALCGGENPGSGRRNLLALTKPGVLIVGLNPVSTDAVGTAVMGAADPRAQRGTIPFRVCENQLVLAEQAGLGTADLAKIEVVGTSIDKARCPYPDL